MQRNSGMFTIANMPHRNLDLKENNFVHTTLPNIYTDRLLSLWFAASVAVKQRFMF